MSLFERAVERVSMSRQWWAHTAWFQFAHKPLCERFAADVLRVGRWRLCRSCTFLYSGAAATAMVLVLAGPSNPAILTLLLGLLAPVVGLSWPVVYRRMGRRARDAIRCSTGVLLALWFALLLSGQLVAAAAIGSLAVWLAVLIHRRRRVAKRSACGGCSELGGGGVCSGYASQAESVRSYCHAIEQRVNGDHHTPPMIVSLSLAAGAAESTA